MSKVTWIPIPEESKKQILEPVQAKAVPVRRKNLPKKRVRMITPPPVYHQPEKRAK